MKRRDEGRERRLSAGDRGGDLPHSFMALVAHALSQYQGGNMAYKYRGVGSHARPRGGRCMKLAEPPAAVSG